MIKKTLLLMMLLGVFASCNHIDNKVLPSYTVRIDLRAYAALKHAMAIYRKRRALSPSYFGKKRSRTPIHSP